MPSTAQSSAESTWMSTPTGGEIKTPLPEVSARVAPVAPAALPAALIVGKTEDVESSDDDELVIEDVTDAVEK